MTDGYDLFCAMKLLEDAAVTNTAPYQDDVSCACANYLEEQGQVAAIKTSAQRAMQMAAELIPTTSNMVLEDN